MPIFEGLPRLVTLIEYRTMTPFAQGYVVYWQGERPGSELKGFTNPYPLGSAKHLEWNRGQEKAVLDAQDSEE